MYLSVLTEFQKNSIGLKYHLAPLKNFQELFSIIRNPKIDLQRVGFILKEVRAIFHHYRLGVIFSTMAFHRATGLAERLVKTLKEQILLMAQEKPKPILQKA